MGVDGFGKVQEVLEEGSAGLGEFTGIGFNFASI